MRLNVFLGFLFCILFTSGCNVLSSSPTSDASLLQPAPEQFGIQSVTKSGDFLVVSWSQASGATHYSLYRATVQTRGMTNQSIGNYTLVSTDVTSPFTDTTVVPGQSYAYLVTASGPGGVTSSSNGVDPSSGTSYNATVTVTAGAAPTLASSTPTNGATIRSAPSSIALTFSEAVNADASAFSTSGTCTTGTIASVSGSGTSSVTVNFTGASCTNTQTFILTIDLASITSLAGIAGSGTESITLTDKFRKIFVTSSTTEGNIGGISGADSLCANDANKPADGSTYKAMIVDGTTRAACTSVNCGTGGAAENLGWVLAPSATYVRTDGTTQIGTTTSAGIFSFNLSHSVGTSAVALWTGLDLDWTADSDTCTSWTSNSSYGTRGQENLTTSNAIYEGSSICTFSFSLYCVEQ